MTEPIEIEDRDSIHLTPEGSPFLRVGYRMLLHPRKPTEYHLVCFLWDRGWCLFHKVSLHTDQWSVKLDGQLEGFAKVCADLLGKELANDSQD